MSKRVELLREAIELTSGDRNRDYGDPVENHQRIADIYNAITGKDATATDAVLWHVCTKLSRIQTSPHKSDSYTDAMAYLGILWECEVAKDQQSNHSLQCNTPGLDEGQTIQGIG